MNELLSFYENELGAKDFYSLLMHKIKESTNLFNQNIVFNNTDSSAKVICIALSKS
jgi:hypothetical protein